MTFIACCIHITDSIRYDFIMSQAKNPEKGSPVKGESECVCILRVDDVLHNCVSFFFFFVMKVLDLITWLRFKNLVSFRLRCVDVLENSFNY